MTDAKVCWMVWSLTNVSFWPTKKRAKADAEWQMANGAPEVIITKTKIYRVLSDGSDADRVFQTPRVLRFSQETSDE